VRHRCAVCWEWSDEHDGWLDHAEAAHGSTARTFGFIKCRKKTCPGVEHANRLPNYGLPKQTRQKPDPQPYTAKDGTVYVPQKLPFDGAHGKHL
jgi:hypothetical protein